MKKIAISLVTMWSDFTSNSLKTLFESDINDKSKYDCTLYIFINSINNSLGRIDAINSQILEMKKNYNFKIVYKTSLNNEGITVPRISIMEEILKTDAEYFLEIHDDMIFTDDFFSNLMAVSEMNKKYKIVMPGLLFVEDLKTENSKDVKARGKQGKILTENPVQAHPWLIDISLIKEIGYYDKAFSPSAGEDDDFYKRAYDAGYTPVIASMSLVGHKSGFTRNATKLGYCEYVMLFSTKHKMTIPEFQVNILDKNRKVINY